MLYLEDYLEMIEHLPQELRDRFTEMRELDLSVQNDNDTIDKRIKGFFGQCRRNELTGAHADTQFEAIKKDYYKVVEDSEEKVQLSNQIYELVDRYLRRLDTELLKFKCELEADNQGITELLEKRSLELDGSSSIINQKENRYFGSISQNRGSAADRYRHKVEKRRDSGTTSQLGAPVEKRQAITSGLTTPTLRPATPNLTQVLQSNSSVAYTGNATIIAQAAAQAIEKTQQMQQGRRTASLKASYEAIHGSGMNTHELLMGRDLNSTASHALQSMDRDVSFASTASGSIPKRYKKKVTTLTNIGAAQSPQTSGNLIHQIQTHSNDSDEMPSTYINKDGMVVEQTADGEWTYDPNEPRYCICNQVSYGEMVACDNSECPLEWFHYPCVGITTSPKGKWYCPMCSKNRKKKNA